MSELSTIEGHDAIARYRLITLRAGVRLEAKGMTRSGRSCTAIAKEELGIPRNMSRECVIEALTHRIEGTTA